MRIIYKSDTLLFESMRIAISALDSWHSNRAAAARGGAGPAAPPTAIKLVLTVEVYIVTL